MNTQLRLGRYDCPACPERFASIGDKKRHVRNEHADSKKKAKS